MANEDLLLNLYRAIPDRSEKIIVDQYPGDDPETEGEEDRQVARGEHDAVRYQRARITGTVAETYWRLNGDWGPPQWEKSLAVARKATAKLTVSWNPGAGISQWKEWSTEHARAVDWHLKRLQLMRKLSSSQDAIGWHIINHEHGVVGTADEVADPTHRAVADTEVVTTFLKAIVGAMHVEFPQSTVMIYNECHWWERDIHFDEVPAKRRIGDVPNFSGYPGTIDRFDSLTVPCVDLQHGLAYPWLWMSQFNVWAGGEKWWYRRERYHWHEKHLVNYMTLVGKHIRANKRLGGCIIHQPLILSPMHVAGLAALVGSINDGN